MSVICNKSVRIDKFLKSLNTSDLCSRVQSFDEITKS